MRRTSIRHSLVIAEYKDATLDPAALELISAARQISESITLGLIVHGSDAAELGSALDVESIIGIRVPSSIRLDDSVRAQVVKCMLAQISVDVALLPSTWEWAPAAASIAVAHNMSLVSQCVSIETTSDGSLLVQRLIYSEKILVELVVPKVKPALLMLNEGSWAAAELGSGSTGIDFLAASTLADKYVQHLEFIDPEPDDEDLKNASIIFAVGRGLGTAAQIDVVAEAARKCGAALAASRPIVDMGILPRSSQIGQSGLTVSPRVYVAFGISGAPQHLEGMRGSQVVVAINTDRDAPIFGSANFGAFVDAFEVAKLLCDK